MKTLAKEYFELNSKIQSLNYELEDIKDTLIKYYQNEMNFGFIVDNLENIFNLIMLGVNADILEDKNYSQEQKRLISRYLTPGIDISVYLNPKYNLELIEKICQILNCEALELNKREDIVNLLVIES